MAGTTGTKKNVSRRSRPLRYFYLDGNLHISLHINRGADQIITWCYPLAKRVVYTYSDVKRRKETAFSTTEVGEMLNRKPLAIKRGILKGGITPPQFTYSLNEKRHKQKYKWAEKDIINAHEYFSNTHYGRPRKDGLITPHPLPSLRELRAMIRNEQILYVRDEDGDFKPVWQAADFS